MSIWSDLHTLSFKHYLVALAFIIATALPGLLFLFVHKNSLFVSLDTIKLILLALSIALPVFAFNYINAFFILPAGKDGITAAGEIVYAAIQTILIFNGATLISYYFEFSVRGFIALLLAGEVLAISANFAVLAAAGRKRKAGSSAGTI